MTNVRVLADWLRFPPRGSNFAAGRDPAQDFQERVCLTLRSEMLRSADAKPFPDFSFFDFSFLKRFCARAFRQLPLFRKAPLAVCAEE